MASPRATERYQARIAGLTLVLLESVRRTWRKMDPARPLEQQYQRTVGPQMLTLVMAAQVAATREADAYVAAVLNELAFGPETAPGVLTPRGLVGLAGDGRPVESLLASSVGTVRAREAELRRMAQEAASATAGALTEAQAFMETVAASILADTARAAEEAAMGQRPWLTGYVRVAEPGACSRCLVLTGKFFLFSDGFDRHPRCRCSHIPAPSDQAALRNLLDVETPERRFDALSEREQDQAFGKAGAQAIRDGADISRVVNARRGMSRAQTGRPMRVEVNGRMVYTTTEATTRRGRVAGQARGVRLMPESILELAGDDIDERIRLLRLHGYIT